MFKSFAAITAAVLVSANSISFADENDLFSQFSSSSVFKETAKDTVESRISDRITSSEDLRDRLKTAGFDAKVVGSRIASCEKKLEPWTFPVLGILSEDEAYVTIVLGLTTITDASKELPAEKLLEMMAASQKHAPALFAFHAERARTELSVTLSNVDLTGSKVRDEINRMSVLAKNTAEIWATDQQKQAPTTISKPESSQPPLDIAKEVTGQWSAAKSDKEAFAIAFKSDGTFNLVYINDGQQTKSSGQFAVTQNSLTLTGSDGLKLEGKLTLTSATEFQLELQNSSVLTFKKS